MKISVIIPLYNCEKYIERCIRSVVEQRDLQEKIEVLVVNDGSEDRGPELVEKLQEQYPNIKLIHQKNSGVAAARNKGLTQAQGKYVQFVDADDYIEPGFYRYMFPLLSKIDADIFFFKDKIVYSDHEVGPMKFFNSNFSHFDELITGDEFIVSSGFHHAVWCFLIKKEIIKKQDIKFQKYCWGEDILFIIQLLLSVKKVYAVNQVFYNYVQYNSNAATKKKGCEHLRRMADSYLQVAILLLEMIDNQERNVSKTCRETIENNIKLFVYFGILKFLRARTPCSDILPQLMILRQKQLYPVTFMHQGVSFIHNIIRMFLNKYVFIKIYCSLFYHV